MNGHKKLVSHGEMSAAAHAPGRYAVAGPAGSVFAQEAERQLTP